MDKKFLVIILIVVVIAGVITFLLWPKVEELSEVKITHSLAEELSEVKIAQSLLSPSLFVAVKKDFFEEEDLKVKLQNMSNQDSVLALLAGEIDYAHLLMGQPLIEASLRGAPIKTIMLIERYQVLLLFAQPELEFNDIKTIGIFSSPSDARYYYQALKFIEDNNLKAEIIKTKKMDELNNFFFLGTTDAVLMPAGRLATLLLVKGFPVLETSVEIIPTTLSIRDDKIAKNPEEVQKIVRVLERAIKLLATKPEEIEEIILMLLNLEKTEKNLQLTEELYPLTKTIYNAKNIPADEGAELLIKIAKAGEFETFREVEAQIIIPEDFQKVFDFRFLK